MKSRLSQILTITAIGIGCSIFVVILSFTFSGLITAWENKTLDYRFKLRGVIPTHPDIVLIDIDDASMEAIGRWPWDRTYHGRMIGILSESGAAAIGYDVLFDQTAGAEGDAVLMNDTKRTKNLYYPVGFALAELSQEYTEAIDNELSVNVLKRFVLPQEMTVPGNILSVERSVTPFDDLLAVSNGAGHISSNRDPDGTIRRVPLVVNLGGRIFPAFGLSVAAAYLQVQPEDIHIVSGSHIRMRDAAIPGEAGMRDIDIPIDDRGMMVINYAGRWEDTFTHYSFIDVMKAAESEGGMKDIRESLSGRIALVSNTATGYDLKPIPVEANFPGGGIHASIVNTILTQNFLRNMSPAGKLIILVFSAICAAWVAIRRQWKMSLLSLCLIIGAYWVMAYLIFSRLGFITEIFSPSLGMILSYSAATLYTRGVEQKRSAGLFKELEQLGRNLKSKSEELLTKDNELSMLREDLSMSMSVSDSARGLDDISIQKIAALESKMESTLREKALLFQSKQQLEIQLARILSEPAGSELHLESGWEKLQQECAGYGIITRSMNVLKLFEQVKKAAQTKSPILILGESGTGKELFAMAIHETSNRYKRPFVVVDTPAVSDNLFESDLFGHVRGGFTGAISDRRGYFETAQGGSIFLDEIGDLSARIQAGLLGVLQRYEIKRVGSSSPVKIDVRVIAATNKNLLEEIANGNFREDLYYRLNVVSVVLPPLRERMEDIEPLVHYFLGKYCAENGLKLGDDIKGLTPAALARLKAHPWKGNIRELENVIARSIAMARGEWIAEEELGLPQIISPGASEPAEIKDAGDQDQLPEIPSPLAGKQVKKTGTLSPLPEEPAKKTSKPPPAAGEPAKKPATHFTDPSESTRKPSIPTLEGESMKKPATHFTDPSESMRKPSIPTLAGESMKKPATPSSLAGEGRDGGDNAFLSTMKKNAFSIGNTARALEVSRGTVAHRFKGICLESLLRNNGDKHKASLELSGELSGELPGELSDEMSRGEPESVRRIRERIDEYYSNLLSVVQKFDNSEEAMAECRRRFKNLKGKYFKAIEELVKRHFEK